jgi:ComF family protein
MSLRSFLLDLLFPPKCPFCGTVLDKVGICARCRSTLPWTDEPERKISGGVRCASPLWYEGQVRGAMLRFKFRGAVGCAEPLGALMAQCASEHFLGEFDAVTWAPVSRKRLRQRGYDQAQLLAKSVCKCWNIVPEPLLCKVQNNPAQSGLDDAAARRANVLGVYTADEQKIRGRRLLLVDDIVTTGSTLGEAARTLLTAGAQNVVCVTLCRTPKKPQEDEADKTGQNGKNVLAK